MKGTGDWSLALFFSWKSLEKNYKQSASKRNPNLQRKTVRISRLTHFAFLIDKFFMVKIISNALLITDSKNATENPCVNSIIEIFIIMLLNQGWINLSLFLVPCTSNTHISSLSTSPHSFFPYVQHISAYPLQLSLIPLSYTIISYLINPPYTTICSWTFNFQNIHPPPYFLIHSLCLASIQYHWD